MADHAVGSKISLISKSEIRYEGFLHFINPDENTVGLKNVRMCGTEGRKGDPKQEIAAADTLYEFIIFRGADIKDLTVYEDQPRDPAIVQAQPARKQPAAAAAAPAPARQAAPAPQRVVAQPAATSLRDDARGGRGFYDRQDQHKPQSAPQNTRGWERRDAPAAAAPARHDHHDTRFEKGKERSFEHNHYNKHVPAEQPHHGGGGHHRGGHHGGGQHQQQHQGGHHAQQHHGGGGQQYHGGGGRGRGGYQHEAPAHHSRGGRGRGGAHHAPAPAAPAPRSAQHVDPQAAAAARAPRGPAAHTGQFELAADPKAKEEYKEEFDFRKAGEAFAARKKEEDTPSGPSVAKGYDKQSSFFDTISCETTERLAKRQGGRGAGGREEREAQSKIDTETFGREAVGAVRHSFRHRGGHRGGRGGGRGYGNRF